MRLGQLARKLDLRPDQIVEFLAKKNIQIDEGSNTRLEDTHVALVVEKFAPAGFEITQQELPHLDALPEVEAPGVIAAHSIEKIEARSLPIENSKVEVSTSDEKIEIIKAPKVELSGLKVLGKIDLPEPKKKELLTPENLNAEGEKEIKPRQERIKSQRNRSLRPDSRAAKNPIALQREREEREAQGKREEAKALEKEKRAQHYFKKVKVVTPVKTSKRDQVVEEIPQPTPKPKTLIGKFFRWFRT